MTFNGIVIARSASDAAIHDTTQTLDCRAALAMTTLDHAHVFMLSTASTAA
jgi:hypothetical protein